MRWTLKRFPMLFLEEDAILTVIVKSSMKIKFYFFFETACCKIVKLQHYFWLQYGPVDQSSLTKSHCILQILYIDSLFYSWWVNRFRLKLSAGSEIIWTVSTRGTEIDSNSFLFQGKYYLQCMRHSPCHIAYVLLLTALTSEKIDILSSGSESLNLDLNWARRSSIGTCSFFGSSL